MRCILGYFQELTVGDSNCVVFMAWSNCLLLFLSFSKISLLFFPPKNVLFHVDGRILLTFLLAFETRFLYKLLKAWLHYLSAVQKAVSRREEIAEPTYLLFYL